MEPNKTDAMPMPTEKLNISNIEISPSLSIQKHGDFDRPVPVTIIAKIMNDGIVDAKGIKATFVFTGDVYYEQPIYISSWEEHRTPECRTGIRYVTNKSFALMNVTIPIGNLDSGEVKEITHNIPLNISTEREMELIQQYRKENPNLRSDLCMEPLNRFSSCESLLSISNIELSVVNITALN